MMCKKNVVVGMSIVMLLLGGAVVQARLLLYEPFDYATGAKLDGQTPPDGMGMTGSWTATDHKDFGMTIVVGDGSNGEKWDGVAANITQTGGFISVGADGRAHVFGHVKLASSVTDTFVDGSTTWMSCVSAQGEVPWGYWPMLAIGTGELQEDRGANAAGQAIGGGGYYQGNRDGLVGAHYWNDEDGNGSYEIHAGAATVDSYTPQLLVFKITWSDAGNDVVKAYSFDVNAGAPAPTEAAFDAGAVFHSANLDQSQFDTLSYGGGRIELDEIRIGTTFGDVTTGTSIAPTATDPNPADAATDVLRDVILRWAPGELADTHDVYFGTMFEDVNDADVSDPRGVLAHQGQILTTYDPGRLDFAQTYYWRIDEVNAPPDSTIFRGSVWSFTTEPIAYPVENVTATASSALPAIGPENTVNGSGLDADGLHSAVLTDMWLSDNEPNGAWIEFEFEKVHTLHEMWVWNSNQLVESIVGFGIKEVVVEYSSDGTSWTMLEGISEFAQAPGAEGYAPNTIVDFGGAVARYVRINPLSSWGGLAQYSLSEVGFSYIPVFAGKPQPESGAAGQDLDATLTWRAGRQAAAHDVYLSPDRQAVIDGTAPLVTVNESNYAAASLDIDTTYYWRVDEVNEAEDPALWEGDIWEFSTVESLVVDDFESYNDIEAGQDGSNLVYLTWTDGFDNPSTNGSTIGYTEAFQPTMETQTVHGGKQSVPLMYNNSVASLSEVTVDPVNLAIGPNWTKGSPQTLGLWFYGDPGNAVTEQLYIELNGVKVSYPGDAADVAQATWTQWMIDLAAFGIDLSSVSQLSVGFERTGPSGGSGTVLVDDILLYGSSRAPQE
ncbi:MAG: discoidin domain-containing protein [Planctomycetota bacterium]|jgi:hypothetical protein